MDSLRQRAVSAKRCASAVSPANIPTSPPPTNCACLQVKDLYDAPLVLTTGAGDAYEAYLAVAQRYGLPMQFNVPTPHAVARVRQLAAEASIPVLIAGVIDPSKSSDA